MAAAAGDLLSSSCFCVQVEVLDRRATASSLGLLLHNGYIAVGSCSAHRVE